MKHIFSICASVFLMTFIFVGTISADRTGSTSVTVYENGYNDNDDNKRDPSDGRRSLPTAEIIFIDFINNSISGPSILDHITDYEIWDESGESCFSVSYDGSSFVQTLKMLPTPGIYSIVLRGPDVVLSGYIQF